MAVKFNRSKHFFGQLAGGQSPQDYGSTMSSFYGGVGSEQTGAVKKIGEGVEKETKGLAGKLGLTETVGEDGKVSTSLSQGGPFAVTATPGQPAPATTTSSGTAATPSPTPPATPTKVTVRDKNADETLDQYLAYLKSTFDTAGGSVEEWKKSGKSAEEYLNDLLTKTRTAADKARTAAEGRLTEGKLGQRAEESELEKQAKSYQNVLATEPGTSNIKALAMLTQFYDPKYLTLESGLRQGEMALGRQEAIGNVEAMSQAEAARAGAIGEYGKQVKGLGQELMSKIGEQEEAKRKEFKDFYSKGQEEAEATQKDVSGRIKKTEADIEAKDAEDLKTASKDLENDPTYTGIENVLNAISGRAGNNWLNTRGNEALKPIKQEMITLSDEAKQIAEHPTLSTKEKIQRLNKIKDKVKQVRGKVARELAAFLGDQNTHPGDALDAAEQIMAAGMVDDLSEDERAMIRQRLWRNKHVEYFDKNHLSSAEKLARVYKAFGGTEDIATPAYRQHAKDKSMTDNSDYEGDVVTIGEQEI